MFTREEISQILFIDIETATVVQDYEKLPSRMKHAWEYEARKIGDEALKEASAEEKFYKYAGLFPEFGRVVCISAAYIDELSKSKPNLIIKSFCGSDEVGLLMAFQGVANKKRCSKFCAHNGREFDFPFIGKRFIIQGLPLPCCLVMRDKAVWETRHLIDTMHLWKFSVWKEYRRLELLCAALDIPTSKDDMDGNMVNAIFWQQRDYPRITNYCEKDVTALAQVVLRMSSLPLIEAGHIVQRETLFLHKKEASGQETV